MSAQRVPFLRPAANALGCLLVLLAAACTQPGASVGSDTDPVASADSALTIAQCSFFAVNDKVKVCHRTGAKKKPYELIRTNQASCGGHAAHTGDYVGIDDENCNGSGCFPVGAPFDGTVECCPGLAVVNGRCADVNECLTNNGGCGANAICTNTVGSRTCACAAGFRKEDGHHDGRDGDDDDDDEDRDDDGDTHDSDRHESGRCGHFHGALVCVDINECATNNGGCPAGATCTNNVGAAPTCTTTNRCANVTCAAADQCHVAGTCDPATGQCSNPAAPSGTACNDASDATYADHCDGAGACGGTTVICPENTQCTGFAANGTGTCTALQASTTTTCNDGSLSTFGDFCDGNGGCAGSPVVCPANTQCTAYVPNGTAFCNVLEASFDVACDDASATTFGDHCDGFGGCAGAPVVCPQATQCTSWIPKGTADCAPVQAGTTVSCDDASNGTYADHCDGAGACTGSAVVCPANSECMSYVANGTRTCTEAPASATTSCDDGQVTTYDDHCSGAGACAGTTVVCPTATQCAKYAPNGTATCATINAADGSVCNDGNACTQADSCQAGTCTGASPVTCTAADQCHVAGSCDPGTGRCSNPTAADGTACDDRDTCTTDDACSAGTCVAAPTCQNGSTCLGGSPAVCRCSGNYYGATCSQLDVDECATNNGGCPVSAPLTSGISPKAAWTSAGFPGVRDLDLHTLGLAAGDTVNLSMLGDFNYIGLANEGVLAGVFSRSSSVADAVFTTLPAFSSGGTEVAQDFLVSWVFHRNTTDPKFNGSSNFNGVRVVIPSGATHLLVELWDNNYADNPVTDSNLAVSVTKVTCLNTLGSYACQAPITAPSAPSVTSVSAGNAQATVGFSAPTNDGGAPITAYTVTANPGGLSATGTSSPITVAGLANGVAYTFTVTATNSAGTSAASAASAPTTPRTVPDAPSILTVVPGNAAATITFSPAADGGSPVLSYTVTSSPGAITATASGSPLTVTGLTNGVAYTFTVKASNAVGSSAASAASAPVTPVAAIAPPKVILTLLSGNNVPGSGQLDVATGYFVYPDGREVDPFTSVEMLPALPTPPSLNPLDQSSAYLTLDPDTDELMTYYASQVDLSTRQEVDSVARTLRRIVNGPIYYITDKLTLVDSDFPNTQIDPVSGEIVAVGEPYTILPTPGPYRLNPVEF